MYKDDLKKDIDLILDVFAGADGGVGFVKFNFAVLDIASKLEDGTLPTNQQASAIRILDTVAAFSNLLRITNP